MLFILWCCLHGLPAVSHSSLRSLAEVTASTAAERFALLEARDQLVKAGQCFVRLTVVFCVMLHGPQVI